MTDLTDESVKALLDALAHRAAAKGLRVRELLLDVENAINEPPRRWDIEPADVRDYRHDLYRIWSPLRDIILAALSAHEAKEADNG